MKHILFAAINSRYNHTNLAIRSISAYIAQNIPETAAVQPHIAEYTINQPPESILRGIAEQAPDMVLFSVYIWNAELSFKIIHELKKVLPDTVIGAGGPEVSFDAEKRLHREPALDFIMTGEGEQTALEIAELCAPLQLPADLPVFFDQLRHVPGVCIAKGGAVAATERTPLQDLSVLPFPYPELKDAAAKKTLPPERDTRIYYYESSRGCPFHCSYCLSSIDKSVRFMPLARVFSDLQIFLDCQVKLVKFIDRTFNLDEKRYLAIWKYICENHNGCTMFHFEIAAQQLSDTVLDFLQTVPEGIMQFEIGIQSITPQTLREVGRDADISRLKQVISRIPKRIHQHLDLIAGLPHENLEAFSKSFNYALSLQPGMLQLGFLKVLSGTAMEQYALQHKPAAPEAAGYEWLSFPPYEVLRSPDMSYRDLLFLKDAETVLDKYYNSGLFSHTMAYLLSLSSVAPFDFFSALAKQFRSAGIFAVEHKTGDWTKYLYECISGTSLLTDPHTRAVLKDLLRFDFMLQAKCGCFPDWYERHYSKDAHREALRTHMPKDTVKGSAFPAGTRELYAHSDYDTFFVNPDMPGTPAVQPVPVLFVYEKSGSPKSNRYYILQ